MTTYNINSYFSIRVISAVLLCAIIFSLSATSVFSAQNTASAGKTENAYATVTAHKSYKIKLRNAVYAGDADNGKTLTDTKYSSVGYEEEEVTTDGWVVIGSYDGETDYRATITVDIGYIAKGISLFYFRAFHGASISAETPSRARAYVSKDGEDFTLIGELSTTTDLTQDYVSAIYRINTKEKYDARYVRFVLDCDGTKHLYLNEIGAAIRGNIFFASGSETVIDGQGVIYSIKDNAAHVIGAKEAPHVNSGSIAPSDHSFNEDDLTYTLGIGSDNEITVISDFIDESRQNYSGIPNNVKYIVIHNTGTTEEDTDAERYNHRMHVTDGETSWHYTVDNKVIYHSLPDSIVGWHSGASHNYESIGIEICTNGAPKRSSGKLIFSGERYESWLETHFRPALKNTAMLTAELLTRYGLTTDAVIQHYDVSEKNCPLWLRYKDGKYVYEGTLWIEFMGYVETYYALLNGSDPSPRWDITEDIILPDYIKTTDGNVYPVTHIDSGAFTDKDNNLRTVTLGKMITDIDSECFDGSIGIESVIPDENENFYTDADGILYDRIGNVIFDPSDHISAPPNPKEDCKLDIRERDGKYYIIYSDESYTLRDIVIEYGAEICNAKRRGAALAGADLLRTGDVITMDGARFYVSVRGDVDGNGKTDAIDYIYVKRTCLKTYKPKQYEIFAMAISNGESVEVLDYLMIKRYVLGTYNIYK